MKDFVLKFNYKLIDLRFSKSLIELFCVSSLNTIDLYTIQIKDIVCSQFISQLKEMLTIL